MKTVVPSSLLKLALIADAVGQRCRGRAAAGRTGLARPVAAAATRSPRRVRHLPGRLHRAADGARAQYQGVWSVLVGLIVIGNVGWAAGCVGLLVSGWLAPNALGVAFTMVQAIAVLIFATLEFRGLATSTPVPDATGARA